MWIRTLSLTLLVGCTQLDSSASQQEGSENPGGYTPDYPECKSYDSTGRAWGLSASALGIADVPAVPDTAAKNPNHLAGVGWYGLGDTVFDVRHDATHTDGMVSETASASTNGLSLSLAGLGISATTIRANATARGTWQKWEWSPEGSMIQNLTINGIRYPNWTEPHVITVTNPLTNEPIAEVSLLESTGSSDDYGAKTETNALHIHVFDLALTPILDESTDIIIGHAEASTKWNSCDPYEGI